MPVINELSVTFPSKYLRGSCNVKKVRLFGQKSLNLSQTTETYNEIKLYIKIRFCKRYERWMNCHESERQKQSKSV